MKELTKQILDEYARKTGSPLKKWIAELLIDEWEGGGYEDWKPLLQDMTNNAVMNGSTPLIYHSDFRAFYEQHRIEIGVALAFTMEECGVYDLSAFFKYWDKTDPLANDVWNQTLLCCFAFEYGLEFLLADLGIDIWEL